MKSSGYLRGYVQLRDGFYIEVCDRGMKKGMKIRSDSKKAMEDAANRYAYKDVIILGEYKNGAPFVELPAPAEKKTALSKLKMSHVGII